MSKNKDVAENKSKLPELLRAIQRGSKEFQELTEVLSKMLDEIEPVYISWPDVGSVDRTEDKPELDE